MYVVVVGLNLNFAPQRTGPLHFSRRCCVSLKQELSTSELELNRLGLLVTFATTLLIRVGKRGEAEAEVWRFPSGVSKTKGKGREGSGGSSIPARGMCIGSVRLGFSLS